MQTILFPKSLESERLRLRQHKLELAPMMFSRVEENRERLGQFMPWVESTRTIEDVETYIRQSIEKWSVGDLFDYSLFRKLDGSYLGNAGLHSISWAHERCEIGYWICKKFEGQGYISEAVSLLEQTAFFLNFNRIEIRCSSTNHRSAAIPKKLGYHLDGTFRQDVREKGGFRDTLVFSKLKSDT